MNWVERPQNCKGLFGILQLLQSSHLDNVTLETVKLGWLAFHSLTFQLKCLDFQSNQYKKLAPSALTFLYWAMTCMINDIRGTCYSNTTCLSPLE